MADDEGSQTPYLVVDLDRTDRNIASAAAVAGGAGIVLRPHTKAHKCLELAARQLAAGAVGLTVATVAEAEVFIDAGCDDVFIAYPIWAAGRRGARLRALAERARLRVGVDSVPGAESLAHALAGTDAEVVVELDSGHHRTGVDPTGAGELAVAAARAGLDVAGVFTFPGHSYHPGAPGSAARDEADALSEGGEALRRAGIEPRVRSGGSTPTLAATDPDVATETRPGVYVFNDAQQVELGTCNWPQVALTAAATVISRSPGRLVLDAGSKVLGADQPGWVTGAGRLLDHPDARIVALSEHHATVELHGHGHTSPWLGDIVRVVPNHVCSAVNLVDSLTIRASGRTVGRWAVAARGANH